MSVSVPDWLIEPAPGVEVLGNLALLAERPIAVVASRQFPGALLLAAADWAEAWAALSDRPVLASGFQTPAEAEGLRRLLRARADAMRFPARELPKRLLVQERAAVEAGHFAVVSPFRNQRPTAPIATRRNTLLAQVARAAVVVHVAPPSQTLDWAPRLPGRSPSSHPTTPRTCRSSTSALAPSHSSKHGRDPRRTPDPCR